MINILFAATKDIKPEGGGITDTFDIGNLLNGYTGFFLDETIDLIRKTLLWPLLKKIHWFMLMNLTLKKVLHGG